MDAKKAISAFKIDGELKTIKPYGSGLINNTYLVEFTNNKRYILQKINTDLFKNYKDLMNNIKLVTNFLKKKITAEAGDPNRETLTIINTKNGKLYHVDDRNQVWRVYSFIEDTLSYNIAESPEQFYKTGLAFGKFQNMLNEFDANQLVEVLENFHDTRFRYQQFEEAVANNQANRVQYVKKEIEFVRKRKEDAYLLYDMLDSGKLPLRVTHNDTKLSNILLDKDTLEGVAVIDLDTVMPGILLFDFGDSIRSGANTAEEDEKDLSKVNFDLELFEVYTKGFLESAKEIMTETEIEYLPWGARVITFEQAIRFLTDYLNGDKYYTVTHDSHNLERTRNQMKLVKEMEDNWTDISETVLRLANK